MIIKHLKPKNPTLCLALLLTFGVNLAELRAADAIDISQPRWLKSDAPRSGDEDYIFTPKGFSSAGKPAIAWGAKVALLEVIVRDRATGKPTPCRVNVVGPDGNFYQPQKTRLTPYNLTGQWPKSLAGNRPGKAPIRYFGRFFYTDGNFRLFVPPGKSRIEVWKGFEYQPVSIELKTEAKGARKVELSLERTVPMAESGYYSGDTHLHFERRTEADDQTILDLMEAEDVFYSSILCYNGTGSYDGRMGKQDIQQLRGLGMPSLVKRGNYRIMSAQEYRSNHYGHTKVFLSDEIVQPGKSYDPNSWPVFGEAVADIRKKGGLVFWAHGGYSKEIFADFALGKVDGVELMQFGIYRPIGLEGWYKILNVGFRFPALGASDYPACRKLADCRTYVYSEKEPRFDDWLRGAAAGRSFMTSGPLLLLEVDGEKPGTIIRLKAGDANTRRVRIRVRSEVAPITHVDLIVNGHTVKRLRVPMERGMGRWHELSAKLELSASSWIAASAYSEAPSGSADAEAHTNPVYVYFDEKAPYDSEALNWLLSRLDERIAFHRKRKIAVGKENVMDYFESARKRLVEIRKRGGLQATEAGMR